MPLSSLRRSRLKALALIGLPLALISCGWMRPSEELCQKAHLNNVRIVAEDDSMPAQMKQMLLRTVLDPRRQDAMVKSCAQKKTRDQVSCELRAKTFVDLVACGEKFKGKRTEHSEDEMMPKDLQGKDL